MLENGYNPCVYNMLPNIYRNYSKESENYCYPHLKKQDLKTKKICGEPKRVTLTYILMVKNLIYRNRNVSGSKVFHIYMCICYLVNALVKGNEKKKWFARITS